MAVGNSIPPPATGYWAWVRDELKNKADEKWITSELNSLRRMFDDTKTTVTDVRKVAEKPYVCTQMREIDKLREWQDKVTNWKIPAIISIVLLIIGAVGQYFSLKDSVEDGNQARVEIQKTLKKIEEKQEATSTVTEELKQQQKFSEENRKQELREVLKEVISEVGTDSQTKRPRNKRQE